MNAEGTSGFPTPPPDSFLPAACAGIWPNAQFNPPHLLGGNPPFPPTPLLLFTHHCPHMQSTLSHALTRSAFCLSYSVKSNLIGREKCGETPYALGEHYYSRTALGYAFTRGSIIFLQKSVW